ncbi:MAG TPA: short-chain dehydrogenase [Oceanospirillaceae bacterium]|nr:short-chain dehydrogenase [Oceanospirillaceae bacterium]
MAGDKIFTEHLNGRVAVVTGGCGGIGQAICRRFASEGAQVVAADVAPMPEALQSSAHYFKHDVTSEQSAQDLMAFVEQQFGHLDVLVNAAGIEIEKTIEETTLDEWQRIFAINVTGTFLTSKYGVPLMRKKGAGSIINFGSYDGFIADPGLAAYCATKGAVHALTKAMACDYGKENIRVNAICPGFVATPMLESFFGDSGDIESLKQEVRDIHPLRRYGTPDDMANLVNWLAGDEARYASGALWVLDGGLTAQVQQMKL